jgi:pyruvate/2-oxoglutarate dehydrogenase complex dihydrolipoamide dehydrogenase (E3) component
VDGRELRWRTAIIATGSSPLLPSVAGLAGADPLSTDTVWDLRELPGRLVVLGGGPVGCELGQAFARLGSQVTLVEMLDRLLPREEPRASELIASRLREEGVDVRVGRRATEVLPGRENGNELVLDSRDGWETVVFDRILVAVGRSPRTSGLGLDAVGVQVDTRGAVGVDRRLRTSASGVFAIGDVTGLLPFTHVAAHHARVATPNALFHTRTKVHDVLPWVTFTDPELARVGLTEAQARECWSDRAVVAEFDYGGLDRAITAGEAYGFAKLVGDPRRRLVGATVAAPGGGDTVAELVAWVARRAKIDAVSQTVHAYPTLAEGPARAADTFLAARYSTPRVRAMTRPALAALRHLAR